MTLNSLRDATTDQLTAAASDIEPVLVRRARHVISEIERTIQVTEEIEARKWSLVGELMYASHASLRDDYEVSCTELDILVKLTGEIGLSGGVIGSRMTGGGFGGCTVSLVQRNRIDQIAAQLSQAYQQKTGIKPTLFTTSPARGAHIIDC